MSYIHRGEGSRFVILSNIGMSIFKWAMSCNIQLPACYIPGLEKDEETHFLRTSQMNQNEFELKLYFNYNFSPDVDLIATISNFQLHKFNSSKVDKNEFDFNAFSVA